MHVHVYVHTTFHTHTHTHTHTWHTHTHTHRAGVLQVGDRIISLNGVNVDVSGHSSPGTEVGTGGRGPPGHGDWAFSWALSLLISNMSGVCDPLSIWDIVFSSSLHFSSPLSELWLPSLRIRPIRFLFAALHAFQVPLLTYHTTPKQISSFHETFHYFFRSVVPTSGTFDVKMVKTSSLNLGITINGVCVCVCVCVLFSQGPTISREPRERIHWISRYRGRRGSQVCVLCVWGGVHVRMCVCFMWGGMCWDVCVCEREKVCSGATTKT